MSSVPAPHEETLPALNEGQRLLYTFIEPSKTMADIRRNASWWVPWLLVSIVSVAFSYTVDKKIGWDQVMETSIQSNPKTAEKMERIPENKREQARKMQVMGLRISGYAAPVTKLLEFVVVAGALLGLFNFGFGTKLRFSQLMGVTAYGFLPSIFNTLLSILLVFFVEPDVFNAQSPVASNVGYFIPESLPFLKILLGVFDVFLLWQVFLLTVGVAQLSKVKKSTAFAVIFGATFAFYLLLAIISAL